MDDLVTYANLYGEFYTYYSYAKKFEEAATKAQDELLTKLGSLFGTPSMTWNSVFLLSDEDKSVCAF